MSIKSELGLEAGDGYKALSGQAPISHWSSGHLNVVDALISPRDYPIQMD